MLRCVVIGILGIKLSILMYMLEELVHKTEGTPNKSL